MIKRIIITIAIASLGVISMSLTARFLNDGTIPSIGISQYDIVNTTFTMQLMVLAMSFVAIGLIYLVDKENFKIFFRIGTSWDYGILVALGFTAGTTAMMSFSVMSEHGAMNGTFVSLIPLVLFLAATNAWSEEIFTRFVVVVGLHGRLQPVTICWISALIFGVPHFFGTPSGIGGVIMAGFLGWVLMRSVIDTRGMGWAWFIHFLQDVAIFGAGAMILSAP